MKCADYTDESNLQTVVAMPKFAANLSFLFTDVLFHERFKRAAVAGFKGVEYLFPYEHPASDIADWLRANDLEQVLFNLSAGDWAAGERGLACLPHRQGEFAESVEQALAYAMVLDCSHVHCLSGLRPAGYDEAELEATYVANLRFAADRFATIGATVMIEPINSRIDMPGYWAALVYFSSLPEIDTELEDEAAGISNKHKTNIFQFPHLIIGVITLFLYVGVEVIAGDTIINYGASQGIPMSTAKFFTSLTLVGMLVGYIVGIICIPKYISQRQALKISAFCAIIFALGALFTKGYTSISFVALLGLANSLMWPSIWPLAIDGLGKFTKIGSSLLIMAIGGGAILPLIYGRLADKYSFHQAYWLVVPCYIMIVFYAIKGYKLGKTPAQQQ